MTEKHYAGKDAVDGARIDRVEDALTEMDEEDADDDQDADATATPKPAAGEESAASPQALAAKPPEDDET